MSFSCSSEVMTISPSDKAIPEPKPVLLWPEKSLEPYREMVGIDK